jgi:hypothetical protein
MQAGYAQAMKITQRIRTAAGWPDEEIGGIGSRGVDILVVKRPPPVDCSEEIGRASCRERVFDDV